MEEVGVITRKVKSLAIMQGFFSIMKAYKTKESKKKVKKSNKKLV